MGCQSLHTPIGDISVFAADGALIAIEWGWSDHQAPTDLTQEAVRQLHAYFDGDLEVFDLPIAPDTSHHMRKVMEAMCQIPHGETLSYAEVARLVGSSPRAVGGACGRNPLPIIVPCHRVLASGGKIGGYSGAGALDTKRALLILEGALPAPTP